MARCDVCKDLQPENFDIECFDNTGKEIKIPRPLLAASAAAGCEGCQIIHEARRATASGLAFYTDYVCVRQTVMGAPLRISGQNRGQDDYKDWGEVYILEREELNGVNSDWPGIGIARHVAESPLSPTTRNLPNEWLQDCILNHPGCQPASESSLPTRVIYVGAATKTPRLHISHGAKSRYATLSHCWGASTPLTTTISTLERRTKGIGMTEMPKTFHHAVLITQQLGIEYLWIDSLCIIQDSEDDWARESHLMQDVYAQAVVNISADAASDSTKGLISGEHLSHGLKVGNSKHEDDAYVRLLPKLDSSGIFHVPKKSCGPSFEHVLSTRAWVVQERILFPRLLHFSHFEIAWECDTHTLCECTVIPRKLVENNFRKAVLPPQPDVHQIRTAWSELVAYYSLTKVTFNSDRLIAIAGLASRAASAWNKTYIAGLWKEDLPRSLLWRVSKHPSYRLPESFPSWTWASIRGPVKTNTYRESNLTNLDFEFKLRSVWYGDLEEHFDHMSDSQIEWSGHPPGNIEDAQGQPVKPQIENELLTESLKLGAIWGRGWLAKINFNDKHKLPVARNDAQMFLPDCSDLSELPAIPDGELYLLIIYKFGASDGIDRFDCLVLRKADDLSPFNGYDVCYRRIGVYDCEMRSSDNNEFSALFHEQDIFLV